MRCRVAPFESRAKPLRSKQALPLSDSESPLIARFDMERGEARMMQAVAADEIDH
jgi:hypothetical protein